MEASFLQAAQEMDPVDPSNSIRQLAERHRWLSSKPPNTISLRSILDRHAHPQTSRHRLLWYNTFLLQGLPLSLCSTFYIARILEAAGISAVEAVGRLVANGVISVTDALSNLTLSSGFAGVTPQRLASTLGLANVQVLKAYGITLQSLERFSPKAAALLKSGSLDNLNDEQKLGKIAELLSLDDVGNIIVDGWNTITGAGKTLVELGKEILKFFGIDPLELLAKFCQETFALLSSILGVQLSPTIRIAEKPERQARANEIGKTIAPDYEIAALCEVFETQSQNQILNQAQKTNRKLDYRVGPGDSGELASSGLFTVIFDRQVKGSHAMTFTTKGERWRDADASSNKGCLLTVVDVGLGLLELYSTHLFSGGDLLPFGIDVLKGVFQPLSDSGRIAIQIAQVDELVAFFNARHNPQNPAIIIGDFNVSAQRKTDYEALVGRLHKIGMLDAWPFHRYREKPSFDDNKDIPRGDTHASTGFDRPIINLDGTMTANESSDIAKVCYPDSARYCQDGLEKDTTSRIDYIFVENPRPEHKFTLDITRVQRRPFARKSGNIQSELWLSDHLGLDVTLIVSPR